MEDVTFTEKLMLFGIGRQEAVVYLCLLQNGELTGYEVAKLTGISRSNVYSALASLAEHGAAYVVEGAATKYVPVPVEEFCENRIRRLGEVKTVLAENAPKPREIADKYITVEGYEHICDKIHHMLVGAEKRIYFSAGTDFLERWQEELSMLLEKEIKVVLIAKALPRFFTEKETLREKVIFYPMDDADKEMMWEERDKQVRLIIDSTYALTGEATGSSRDTCLYSANRNFVNVLKEAMNREIELIKICVNGYKPTDEGKGW